VVRRVDLWRAGAVASAQVGGAAAVVVAHGVARGAKDVDGAVGGQRGACSRSSSSSSSSGDGQSLQTVHLCGRAMQPAWPCIAAAELRPDQRLCAHYATALPDCAGA
jgi:hypothetical protein